MLKPDNFNLILMSQKFAHDSSCNHQEYWYKTRYGVEGRFYFAFVKHGNKMKILKSELVEESCSQRECVFPCQSNVGSVNARSIRPLCGLV